MRGGAREVVSLILTADRPRNAAPRQTTANVLAEERGRIVGSKVSNRWGSIDVDNLKTLIAEFRYGEVSVSNGKPAAWQKTSEEVAV